MDPPNKIDKKLKSQVGPSVPEILVTALEKTVERKFILELEPKLITLIQELGEGKRIGKKDNEKKDNEGKPELNRQNVVVPHKDLKNNYYKAILHNICDYYKLGRSESSNYFSIHARDGIVYWKINNQIKKGEVTLLEIYTNCLSKSASPPIVLPILEEKKDEIKESKVLRPKMLVREKQKHERTSMTVLPEVEMDRSSKEKFYEEKRRQIFADIESDDSGDENFGSSFDPPPSVPYTPNSPEQYSYPAQFSQNQYFAPEPYPSRYQADQYSGPTFSMNQTYGGPASPFVGQYPAPHFQYPYNNYMNQMYPFQYQPSQPPPPPSQPPPQLHPFYNNYQYTPSSQYDSHKSNNHKPYGTTASAKVTIPQITSISSSESTPSPTPESKKEDEFEENGTDKTVKNEEQ